ncbi:uncharacterized protein EAF02_007153 [Botrytis sinoallii]|uniref:uncharacterized protein n=1 Tax=Botrytis sinoallii TaxID=1463999 RepID=UPI001901B23E|nr:uncharacterized protein EAF02_007153 [Botrytis sinoallii]KAF7880307.1 hypothetical protein EAF02_007153 [Botrytis sinoallii]
MFYHDDLTSQPCLDMARLQIHGNTDKFGKYARLRSRYATKSSSDLEIKAIVFYDLGFVPVDRWVGERWRRTYAKV